MPDARASSSPFGLSLYGTNAPADFNEWATSLKEAGVGFVRLSFDWPLLTEDPAALERQDRQVHALLQKAIPLLGVFSPSSHRHPAASELSAFMRLIVERYREYVRHWEFWHQPDDDASAFSNDEMKSYTALLRCFAESVKASDASSVVHLGGLSKRLPQSLKQIYAQGGKSYFDVVNIHPFVNPLMPDAVGGLRYFYEMVYRAMTVAADEEKPIWFSHLACPGVASPAVVPPWFLGRNPSEKQQAEWVRILYTEPLRWKGVEKVFWARWQDAAAAKDGGDLYGLRRADGSAKPAYEQYKALAAVHSGRTGTIS